MRKKLLMLLLAVTMATTVITGCGFGGGNDGPVNRKEASDKDDDDDKDDKDDKDDDNNGREDANGRDDDNFVEHGASTNAGIGEQTPVVEEAPTFTEAPTPSAGEYIIKTYYYADNSYMGLFSEGLAWVYLFEQEDDWADPKYVGVIDTNGNIVAKFDYYDQENYSDVSRVTPFCNGYASIVYYGGDFFVVNTNGEVVFESEGNGTDVYLGTADDGTIFFRHKTATMSEVKWDFCRLIDNFEVQTIELSGDIQPEYLYSTENCWKIGSGRYSFDNSWIDIFTGETIYGSNVAGKAGDVILFVDGGDMSYVTEAEVSSMSLADLLDITYGGNDGYRSYMNAAALLYIDYDEVLHGPNGFRLEYCELVKNAIDVSYEVRFSNIENGYQAIILRGADDSYYFVLVDMTGNTVYEPVVLSNIYSIPDKVDLIGGYAFVTTSTYDNSSFVISSQGEILESTPSLPSDTYFDRSVELWENDDPTHVSGGYITWAGNGYTLVSLDGRNELHYARD